MSEPISEITWQAINAFQAEPGRLAGRRVSHGLGLYLAVDHIGLRHCLLEIPTVEDSMTDDSNRGISVVARNLALDDQSAKPFLDLTCLDRSASRMFSIVVADIHTRLENGDSPWDAVRTTLIRWRRFWSNIPTERLSDQEVRGLFGELWFLRFWLLPNNFSHALNWYGPTRNRHDFVWPHLAVEVKTTMSAGHSHVINGLDQLIPQGDSPLYFFSLRIKPEPNAGNSLVSLIKSITNLLESAPAALDAFEERLVQTGFSWEQADLYSPLTFRVIDERLYLVDDSFPRLGLFSFSGGLPPGVRDIHYSIDLEVCPHLCKGHSPSDMGVIL